MSYLRFGDKGSIGIARRAATVAGLVDHIAQSHRFPVSLPCPECGGSGECSNCEGSGNCPECRGDGDCSDCGHSGDCSYCMGFYDCSWCHGDGVYGDSYGRPALIEALQTMSVDRLDDVCRHFNYTPEAAKSVGYWAALGIAQLPPSAHGSPLTDHEATQ